MSDLGIIHFRSIMIKREEARSLLKVKNFVDHINAVAQALIVMKKTVAVGDHVDEMLKILHQSAIKNNDNETIAKCEKISCLISKITNEE